MKHLFLKASLILLICLLAACNKSYLQSMGTSPMPTYHEPKWSGETDKNIVLSADVFGVPSGSGLNVHETHLMGGDLSIQYRIFNSLFIQGAFAGAFGKTKFDCSDSPCSSKYEAWLKSTDNDDSYSFWTTQEQLLLGTDILIKMVQLGFGVGGEFLQSGGDYEDKRDDLYKAHITSRINKNMAIYPMIAYWLGLNLGKNAQYGIIQVEARMAIIAKNDKEISSTTGLTYYHPTGFHGGVSVSDQMGFTINLGKSFNF